METTGGPSLYDPLDSQGRSHPTRSRSRSAVPPSAPESQIRENIEMMEISSDECEEIIPPRKKSRRAGVNVPRKGKGPAKVRHLRHVCSFLHFAPIPHGTGGRTAGTSRCSREKSEFNPLCFARNPLMCAQKFDDIQERLTCAFCLGIMWVPYRCVLIHSALPHGSLTRV